MYFKGWGQGKVDAEAVTGLFSPTLVLAMVFWVRLCSNINSLDLRQELAESSNGLSFAHDNGIHEMWFQKAPPQKPCLLKIPLMEYQAFPFPASSLCWNTNH